MEGADDCRWEHDHTLTAERGLLLSTSNPRDCLPNGTRLRLADILEFDSISWWTVNVIDPDGGHLERQSHYVKVPLAEHYLTRVAEILEPLTPVEFPDNVALLARYALSDFRKKDGQSTGLVRIYRKDGELVRETLFTAPQLQHCEDSFSMDYDDVQTIAGQLPDCGGLHPGGQMLGPDASSIVMTVCVEHDCRIHEGGLNPSYIPERTVLYESRDGGLTWERLDSFRRAVGRQVGPAGRGRGDKAAAPRQHSLRPGCLVLTGMCPSLSPTGDGRPPSCGLAVRHRRRQSGQDMCLGVSGAVRYPWMMVA